MILGWSSFKVVQMVRVHCISGSQELKIDFLTKNFKNLLVRNHWTDFNIILQKCSFGDPLPRLFKPFGFVKKHGRQGAGLISSPEHEVLMVSYCGQSMSVVRRPSCVVRRPSCGINNCFKSLLLLHPWAN